MKQIIGYLIIMMLALPACGKAKQINPDVKGKFVFESKREKKGLYLLTDGKIKFIEAHVGASRWSPDGKSFACYGDNSLWFFDNFGNFKKKIIEKYQPVHFDWMPDGKSLVLSVEEKKGNGIYDHYVIKKNIEKNIDELLTTFPNKKAGFSVFNIRVSPNGKQVFFSTSDSYMYLMHTDGTGLRKLWQWGLGRGWFPDNTHIAFSTNDDGKGNKLNNAAGSILKMNVDTGETKVIEEMTLFVANGLSLSRDGKYFVYGKPTKDGGSQIVICPVGQRTSEKEIPVTYSYYVNSKIGYSKDSYPDWWQGE